MKKEGDSACRRPHQADRRSAYTVLILAIISALWVPLVGLPALFGLPLPDNVSGLFLSLFLLPLLTLALAPMAISRARGVLARREEGRRLAMAGLLVAAGSLALMIGIVGHTGCRALAKAHRQMCRCNLEQLSLSCMMYAADHDDRLPPANDWPQATFSYVNNEKLYRCPADWWPWRQRPTSGDLETSYTMSEALSGSSLKEMDDPEQVGPAV